MLASVQPDDFWLKVVVVDAGSSDGTVAALQARFALIRDVHLVHKEADLFWSAGMRVAHEFACSLGPFDHLLYLNDDVLLERDALLRLTEEAESARRTGKPAIIVGTTRAPDSDTPTYGGRVRTSAIHRTRFELVAPADHCVRCETMNMNVALIPKAVADVCGGIDRIFTHAMGDLDYGLRARDAGFELLVGPGFYGACVNDHDARGSWRDPRVRLRNRLGSLLSTRHLPFRPWLAFCRRHTGMFWPFFALWPIAKVISTWLLDGVASRLPKRRA